MSLIYNATFDSQTRVLSLLDKAGNVISSCEVPSKELVDDISKPLTFKATQDGSTVKLTRYGSPSGDFQTSRDGGNTWTDYSINTAIALNTGDEVSFRAKSDRSAQDDFNYFQFKMTGKIEAWHNVMSMYRTNDFATYNTTPGTDAFNSMFYDCASLTKAPVLPATTLAQNCYGYMFYGCTSLTKAPELPATTLYRYCYSGMFSHCTSLTKAPELPATTLGFKCCSDMFAFCTSLTKAPALPATSLDDFCYSEMFDGCRSLTEAPAFLPATTLAGGCYYNMFRGCLSLTEAPALPATTLASGCYSNMFDGCLSLTKAPELPVTKLAPGCYQFMFTRCQSLTKAPELPATTLAYFCYDSMFYECQSLTKAPELPATKLASSCYWGMFAYCYSLTKAPELPATKLASSCYCGMFSGCKSLTKAPELPATTLDTRCYRYMFQGCQSLKEVRVSATTTATEALNDWLKDVPATGDFYCDPSATIFPTDSASGIPKNWRRLNINEVDPAVDDITKPLTFKATQDSSTVKLTKNGSPSGAFQTSRDGGNTWEDYTIGIAITLNAGDEVSFRTKADREFEQSDLKYFKFNMTGKIEAWHNVMSLYRTSDFATYNTVASYAFYKLFWNCTSLTKAPRLPATALSLSCYCNMFEGCRSLTKAPELPATTLAVSCYWYMFYGCRSLTEAPALPATTLADYCYYSMFSGCQSLKEVRVSATKTATDALKEWLKDVPATGDFYCDPKATIFPTGISGIPSGWTRHNIADYPN